jgi:hypothetical protein
MRRDKTSGEREAGERGTRTLRGNFLLASGVEPASQVRLGYDCLSPESARLRIHLAAVVLSEPPCDRPPQKIHQQAG